MQGGGAGGGVAWAPGVPKSCPGTRYWVTTRIALQTAGSCTNRHLYITKYNPCKGGCPRSHCKLLSTSSSNFHSLFCSNSLKASEPQSPSPVHRASELVPRPSCPPAPGEQVLGLPPASAAAAQGLPRGDSQHHWECSSPRVPLLDAPCSALTGERRGRSQREPVASPLHTWVTDPHISASLPCPGAFLMHVRGVPRVALPVRMCSCRLGNTSWDGPHHGKCHTVGLPTLHPSTNQ